MKSSTTQLSKRQVPITRIASRNGWCTRGSRRIARSSQCIDASVVVPIAHSIPQRGPYLRAIGNASGQAEAGPTAYLCDWIRRQVDQYFRDSSIRSLLSGGPGAPVELCGKRTSHCGATCVWQDRPAKGLPSGSPAAPVPSPVTREPQGSARCGAQQQRSGPDCRLKGRGYSW